MAPVIRNVRQYAAAKPTMDEFLALRERMNRVGANFLKLEVETALLFISIGRNTPDEARRKHSCRLAWRAYQTVLHLMPKVDLTSEDYQMVTQGLARLKTELEVLEESF